MSSTPRSQQIQHPLHDPSRHEYKRPQAGTASRSPCPALNALANHGYIRRSGYNLTFFEVLRAVVFVYNFSYPLAFLLTAGGFLTCGRVTWGPTRHSSSRSPSRSSSYMSVSMSMSRSIGELASPSNTIFDSPTSSEPKLSFPQQIIAFLISLANIMSSLVPHFTLDLQALSQRGATKIAHDASYVHPNNVPSTAPDHRLLHRLLSFASRHRDENGNKVGDEGVFSGMSFDDIALYHAERVRLSAALDGLHKTISLGECALAWQVLRGQSLPTGIEEEEESPSGKTEGEQTLELEGTIPTSRIKEWFGDERLPEGWWDATGVRPTHTIGVIHTRQMASHIERIGERK